MPHDPHAWFRAALDELEAPLVAYAERITGELESARDVCQETFLKLARLAPHEQVRVRGHLAEWLYTVCRNAALDWKRRENRKDHAVIDMQQVGTFASPEPHALDRAEEVGAVRRALTGLPANQQEAIRLKFEHGLSYKEIAAVLETSVGNVGWLLHTGLKALKGQLAGLEADTLEGTAS